MLKAFSYLRCSGISQLAGDSFPRQREAIAEFAERNGVQIAEEFTENGVSGKTEMDDRPALVALLAALEVNGIKTVVVEKLDRLARDLMIQETIIGDFQRKGYTLLSTMEPDLCSADPSRVFIRQVFGALAQYDRATLTAKLKAAKDRKRAKGLHVDGQWPYGSKPGEQAVLIKMRGWRDAGMKLVDITAALNTEQIPARKGKPWTLGTVGRILSR